MTCLNRERLTIYSRIILVLYLLIGGYSVVGGLLGGGPGLTDVLGKPVGTDFSNYWVASRLALAGEPGAVYDFPRLEAAQEAATGVKFPLAFSYPPTFLLLILPLALLPYLASLCVWLAVTLSGYLWVVRRIAPHPLTIWLTLAFPGTFQNFFHGQNGFLSAALLGGGLLLLERFPLWGGMLLGLLSYKPHLGVLIPVALLAGRRWSALGGAAASAGALALASALMFGQETWVAFFKSIPFTMELLNTGSVPWHKMATIFAAARLAGAGVGVARLLQGMVLAACVAAVAWTWFRSDSPALRAAVLCLGILLSTPYAFEYDLALLALPIAYLAWEGHTRGWHPLEQGVLLLAWLMPMVAPGLAKFTGLQLGPLVLAALLVLGLRRVRTAAPLPQRA